MSGPPPRPGYRHSAPRHNAQPSSPGRDRLLLVGGDLDVADLEHVPPRGKARSPKENEGTEGDQKDAGNGEWTHEVSESEEVKREPAPGLRAGRYPRGRHQDQGARVGIQRSPLGPFTHFVETVRGPVSVMTTGAPALTTTSRLAV